MLAASPFAVRFSFNGRSDDAGPVALRRAVAAFNVRACEGLVRDRMPVVFADEVAGEMRASEEASLAAIVSTPGAMPPFPVMMVEARTGAEQTGFDFVGVAVASQTILRDEPEFSDALAMSLGAVAPGRVAAVVLCSVWVQQASGAVWGPLARLSYGLGEDYRVVCADGSEVSSEPGVVYEAGVPVVGMKVYSCVDGYGAEDQTLIADCLHMSLACFVRTCGMMNASNVQTVVGGATNENVGRGRRERDRLACVRYHVLRLKVGKELREIAPKGGTRADPLTMVRGHFKDFSRGAGLFGRLRGEKYSHVWCPAFVRGKPEDGAVLRDYALEGVPAGESAPGSGVEAGRAIPRPLVDDRCGSIASAAGRAGVCDGAV